MSQTQDRPTGATVAQLKADIDSGRTGDKVANADPGLSPLGTDDEAGGNPMTPEQVALARKTEKTTNLEPVRDTRPSIWAGWLLPAVIIVIAAVLIAGYMMSR